MAIMGHGTNLVATG